MELLQLRYFLTAAEYQHMTKAAEHLQIAQPALSQAIHRLEAELGVPLFERKNRSIELNEAGRLLQKRLIPIVSALDRIPGELRADQYMSSHTIHLKLLAASTLITNRIIAYRALRPDVNFQLYQAENHADYDLCVSAVRSDLKNQIMRITWSCWKRTCIWQSPPILPMGIRILLIWLIQEMRDTYAWPVPGPSARYATAIFQRRILFLT